MRLIFAAAVCLALAACNKPADEAADHEAMGMDHPDAPEAAPPQMKPVMFEPVSRTAEAFTGAISLSALPRAGANAAPAMRLEAASGLVYETELAPGGAEQATGLDWSAIFSTPIDLANRQGGAASVDVSIVTSQTVPPGLPNGGLCGADPVFAIAIATPIEMPGGPPLVGIATFGGQQWPPADETALCGVFNYAPPQ